MMGIGVYYWSQPPDFTLNVLHEDFNDLSITRLIAMKQFVLLFKKKKKGVSSSL